MRVLIAGCGWLGKAVGRVLVERGAHVWGVRRNPYAREQLERLGIEPLLVDLNAEGPSARLPDGVDAVVACPAPASPSVEAYRATYIDGIALLLARYPQRARRAFVYTSSTGVFGQTGGERVDERSPTRPRSETARLLVEAERQILSSGSGCVLRLSGLYGPGRYGIVDRVRSGRLALGPGDDRWMNFCHLDDAVRAVLATIDRGQPATVYHASDADPSRRREVIRWIATGGGFEPCKEKEARGPADGADRRIDASWSRASLGIELAYPSFRDGLADAVNPAG